MSAEEAGGGSPLAAIRRREREARERVEAAREAALHQLARAREEAAIELAAAETPSLVREEIDRESLHRAEECAEDVRKAAEAEAASLREHARPRIREAALQIVRFVLPEGSDLGAPVTPPPAVVHGAPGTTGPRGRE